MERISALMDGELEGEEAASLVPALKQRTDLREAWSTYHLIGDALRGQKYIYCNVADGVASQIRNEPTVLAPRASSASFGKRWALPSLAAAAAVATVTWMSLQTQQGVGPQLAIPAGHVIPTGHIVMPTVATANGRPVEELLQVGTYTPPSQPAPQIQLSARELQPYILAHQPFSPSTAIQGLAPYVRSVSTVSER